MSFIRKEEERLVPSNRTTDGAAVDVVAQLGCDLVTVAADGREEAWRIERVVAEVFVQTPAQFIRARFCRRHDDTAGRSAELRRRAVGEQFDFGHSIRRQIRIDQRIADTAVL